MSGWLRLQHEGTEGVAEFPDDPGVREFYEARGWSVVDEPAAPATATVDPDAEPWVELVHPLTGARHEFPNHPDALAGAREAGWVEPKRDGDVPARARRKRAAKDAGVPVEDLPDVQPATEESGGGPAAGESAESSATDTEELNRG
jgi:hypothetical protein